MPWHRLSRADRHLRVARDQRGIARADFAKKIEFRAAKRGAEEHDHHAAGCASESGRRRHLARGNHPGLFGRHIGRMIAFRYQAINGDGASVEGVIEAADRKTALQLLGRRGLFPSNLEAGAAAGDSVAVGSQARAARSAGLRFRGGVARKEITAFTRDLAALLEHEDEVRGEVKAAVAYPLFVLGFGLVTVSVLLTFVMPRLFSMLHEMLPVLPLPTLILLKVSGVLHRHWPSMLAGVAGG